MANIYQRGYCETHAEPLPFNPSVNPLAGLVDVYQSFVLAGAVSCNEHGEGIARDLNGIVLDLRRGAPRSLVIHTAPSWPRHTPGYNISVAGLASLTVSASQPQTKTQKLCLNLHCFHHNFESVFLRMA